MDTNHLERALRVIPMGRRNLPLLLDGVGCEVCGHLAEPDRDAAGAYRWTTQGGNALLHIRVADLNGELAQASRGRHWTRPKPADGGLRDDGFMVA